MIKFIKRHFLDILIWGVILWFTGLYVSLIFNYNIWTDEAYTLGLLEGNVGEIIAGTAADVHPPLYYLYAKLFDVAFGYSLQIHKIAAIIPMVLMLIFGATVVRKKFGDVVSFFFLLFITCIPCSMEFAVQVRMYSLAIFLVTVCGINAYLAFDEEKSKYFWWFALTGLLAAYTHYFAFVSVIIITGFLFLAILISKRRVLLHWLAAAAFMIAGYMPWIPSFYRQLTRVSKSYWIPEITWDTVWGYFTWTFDTTVVKGTVYVFLIILTYAGINLIKQIISGERKLGVYGLLCMMVPAFTVITGLILSFFICSSPIYREQYVFPALGLLALCFALGIKKCKPILLAVFSAFLLFVGALQYKECFHQEYRSTLYPQTKAFFEENLKEDDVILYNYELFGFIYDWHFPKDQLCPLLEYDFALPHGTIWFMNTRYETQLHPKVLEAYGLEMEYVGQYGIEHNVFDLYKLYSK